MDSLSSSSTNNLAFAVKADSSIKGSRKERPFFTHCQLHGLTIERCYKLHGYPPGYKVKPKNTGPKSNSVAINQASTSLLVGNFLKDLDPLKCSQLMHLLSEHMATSNKIPEAVVAPYSVVSNFGTFLSSKWIVDSGASQHICADARTFVSMRPTNGSRVTLPEKTTIHVYLIGHEQEDDWQG
ncbi:uncharacterized protein LOC133301265 isoform X2 [Gastrolobium bilobum]|uniref:uncharacterized protein LOC133301265 isoform X2 n=1 Tax=Gastrolobium bilobum TaxID=150636 RepID=UPI002AAFFF7A|nr:uncharacterized protein LOC133301265 isoform X2 [Gastrolobium bilobum]